MVRSVLTFAFAFLLAACANERPTSINSPLLDSGITSNNGGGVRALGNAPNESITTVPGRRQ